MHVSSPRVIAGVMLVAACGGDDPPGDGDGQADPTTTPVYTPDGPCAADVALDGPLGVCAGTFPACGGDPTGTWVVEDWCSDGGTVETTSSTGVYCDDDVWRETLADAASTLNFLADGTLQIVLAGNLEIVWQVPPSCLVELGHSACGDLETAYAGMECTAEVDGACTCSNRLEQTFDGEGTWTACDGRLVLEATGTDTTVLGPYETDYCIDENLMRMVSDPFAFGGFYGRRG